MVKVIIAEEKFDATHLLGKFLDETNYEVLVEEDCDFYAPSENTLFGDSDDTSEMKCVFKFRKGFFSKEEQEEAYLGLREAATTSQNRGVAAGLERGEKLNNREWVNNRQLEILDLMMNPVDSVFEESELQRLVRVKDAVVDGKARGIVWLASKVEDFNFESWAEETIKLPEDQMKAAANEVVENRISKTTYANQVHSGVAGYFDRYPRIPYGRATSYTEKNKEKFERSYPFLQKLAQGFKELLPERYTKQQVCCDKIDPGFYVPETPFTTITVNKTFRTAAHLDAGDLAEGFSNLSVITNGVGYSGGYLVLPEYRAAVSIRPGDLLLVSNHDTIHGNTEIIVPEGGERISLVCYFREKMLLLGSKKYEDCRYDFVESRRKNEIHPLWRPLWNGVSEGMFETEEWYDFLEEKLGRDEMLKYHPDASNKDASHLTCSYMKSTDEPYDCGDCDQICIGRKP